MVQPLVFFQKPRFIIASRTTFVAEVLRHAKGQIGVQPAKKPLVEWVPEHFFEALETFVARTFAIAMPQKEALAVDFGYISIAMHLQANFFAEVTKGPHIVVAHKKVHGNASIGELRQFTEQAHMVFGHHMFVLKPKVKHIAHQINGLGLGGNLV